MSTATTNQVAKESFESKDSKLSVLGFFMALPPILVLGTFIGLPIGLAFSSLLVTPVDLTKSSPSLARMSALEMENFSLFRRIKMLLKIHAFSAIFEQHFWFHSLQQFSFSSSQSESASFNDFAAENSRHF